MPVFVRAGVLGRSPTDMAGVDPDLSMRGWGNFDLGKDSTLAI